MALLLYLPSPMRDAARPLDKDKAIILQVSLAELRSGDMEAVPGDLHRGRHAIQPL